MLISIRYVAQIDKIKEKTPWFPKAIRLLYENGGFNLPDLQVHHWIYILTSYVELKIFWLSFPLGLFRESICDSSEIISGLSRVWHKRLKLQILT